MALGQLYVDKTFGPEGKERTLKMVKAIEQAMHQDIGQLTWMSDTTKQKAYEKLSTIVNNIGYPDKWRDYSTVDREARRLRRQRHARRRLRGAAPAQQDRQADRQEGLGHDAADGERLLPRAT